MDKERISIEVDHSRKIKISKEKYDQIKNYFDQHKAIAYGPGVFVDIYTNKRVPTLAIYQDDNFCWKKQLVYYFEKYGIIPPNEFLKKTFGWTVDWL